jgi:hypothetical protein
MITTQSGTLSGRDARAMSLVAMGPALLREANQLTADLNESYGLVHEVLSEALAAPPECPVDAAALLERMRLGSRRAQSGPGGYWNSLPA